MATMQDILPKLDKVEASKAAIKTEIENKGVLVGDAPFDEYSDKIAQISGGGGGKYDAMIEAYGYTDSMNYLENMLNSSYAVTKDWTSYNNYGANDNIFAIPNILGSPVINFSDFKRLSFIPKIDCSKATKLYSTFKNCEFLIEIELINLDLGDSRFTDKLSFQLTFSGCTALKTIKGITGKPTKSIARMFEKCVNLDVPYVDTSLCNSMEYYFPMQGNQETFPEIDLSSNFEDFNLIFSQSYSKLNAKNMTFAGHIPCNLQMPGDNYTRETMMSVINKLDDYSGGVTHKLVFGAISLERLSTDDIAIANNKNWTLA